MERRNEKTMPVDDREHVRKRLRISIHSQSIEAEAENYADWLMGCIVRNQIPAFDGETLHVVELLRAMASLCSSRKRRAKMFAAKLENIYNHGNVGSGNVGSKSKVDVLEQEILSYRQEADRMRQEIEQLRKQVKEKDQEIYKKINSFEYMLSIGADLWKECHRHGIFERRARKFDF